MIVRICLLILHVLLVILGIMNAFIQEDRLPKFLWGVNATLWSLCVLIDILMLMGY